MVDEVVAGECVHQVTVAGQVRGRNRNELATSGRLGQLGGPGKQLRCTGIDQRGRRHDDWVLTGPSPAHDVDGRGGLTADESSDQPVGVVRCHEGSIEPDGCRCTDDWLTHGREQGVRAAQRRWTRRDGAFGLDPTGHRTVGETLLRGLHETIRL